MIFPILPQTLVQPAEISDVSVMPTRATLDDATRGFTVTMLNRGNRPIRYRIDLCDMQMSSEGGLDKVDKYNYSAKPYLRFAPREVYIQPGTWQKIKVIATLPATAADGEYRSHLSFQPVDVSDPVPQANGDNSKKIRIELKMQTAVTVPVFLRHGHVSASTTVSEVGLTDEPNHTGVHFKLSREGNRTARGDCKVWFVPAGQAIQKVLLGELMELPVYFPNLSRNVFVAVDKSKFAGKKGEIRVEFDESGAAPSVARTSI